jgi:DNA-binding MarR family transcriptional regulator
MFSRWRNVVHDRGATPPQIWLLRILADKGGATPKELADEMCVTPANITGLVRKLERRGFVTRRHDPDDRRVVRLEASPKALAGLAAMRRAARAGAAEVFAQWSVEEIARLTKMLERLGVDAEGVAPLKGARRRQPRRP